MSDDFAHIKIVSDGTPMRTQVLVDGKPTANVQSVVWTIPDSSTLATAVVTYSLAEVEIVGELANDAPRISILASEVDDVAAFLRAHRDAQDNPVDCLHFVSGHCGRCADCRAATESATT